MKQFHCILCGNKYDLINNYQVSNEKIEKIIFENNLKTSAKENINISNLFLEVIKSYEKYSEKPVKSCKI